MICATSGALRKRAHFLPCSVEELVGILRQLVDAAMDVRVMLLVCIDHRLDDLPRPLRGGGVVEIDQGNVVVDFAGENGKVGPKNLGTQGGDFSRRSHAFLSAGGDETAGRSLSRPSL